LLPGCAVLSSVTPPETAPPPLAVHGLVLAVDGAGGFEIFSRTIRDTASADNLPLEVRCFRWTHGYWRVIADQMHAAHLHSQSQKLAELVLACRREAPQRPISLIAHSAGCGVVLRAAKELPPNTLERILLLAPAVSAKHDLRPALISARQGIDVFFSEHDWACLGLGTLLAGTTDRYWEFGASGKSGFQTIPTCPEDEALYAKLRQYPWDPSLSWTGHRGGHYGAYQPMFLRLFVFPLLVPATTQTPQMDESAASAAGYVRPGS
jgi:hypothetical protein